MNRKLGLLICAVSLLLSIFLAVVMPFYSEEDAAGVINAGINESGELILTYSNGEKQNLGVVVGQNGTDGTEGLNGINGSDGSLTIMTSGSSTPAAVSKGLRSAVSILCKFQVTTQSGSFLKPSTTTKEYSSAGSGVIYQLDKSSGDAFIITNYHVVYNASSNAQDGISDDISVYLYGEEFKERAIKATYVGGSLYYDIAVLRIENSDILKISSACAVTISNSNDVIVGDDAIAIGNAQGLGISSTSGIVSVDSEYITMTAADDKTEVTFRVMRVDTAINSGNSGGGLYNDEGNLIGIVNAKIIHDGVENIGYAIPSNIAISVADNIIDHCYGTSNKRLKQASLGFTVSITDSKAVYNSSTGMTTIVEKVKISDITSGSLASGVLQTGDIIVSIELNSDTTMVTRKHHVNDMMLDLRVGDTVTFSILRGGEEKSVIITVTSGCMTEY